MTAPNAPCAPPVGTSSPAARALPWSAAWPTAWSASRATPPSVRGARLQRSLTRSPSSASRAAAAASATAKRAAPSAHPCATPATPATPCRLTRRLHGGRHLHHDANNAVQRAELHHVRRQRPQHLPVLPEWLLHVQRPVRAHQQLLRGQLRTVHAARQHQVLHVPQRLPPQLHLHLPLAARQRERRRCTALAVGGCGRDGGIRRHVLGVGGTYQAWRPAGASQHVNSPLAPAAAARPTRRIPPTPSP
ncbi:hypothetical protein ABB37_08361 [Leptomonas pyrrhocoris]|uniref:Uncharacterized protein n=1 Tax=Leptomonas pyrrhocoris TaxID=157538 RepID=A0A0M9FT48_LEPPY|nr:hypothetical protein ABB37_08361 [Leptomonas pyrrhocoris]KPA75437.1 hypothetical protein ABB37_08361 [Leptomonas pyrrhocoris]|eukprot:XP_015653876.1 hypothetical protein ABB37_08361 [Leptomonas pyrrhocoris]